MNNELRQTQNSVLKTAIKDFNYDDVQKIISQKDFSIEKEVDGDGNGPLHWVVEMSKLEEKEGTAEAKKVSENRLKIMKALFFKKANVNLRNKKGCTPLAQLCYPERGSYDKGALKLLLKHGADPNIPEYKSINTPLHFAAKSLKRSMFLKLLGFPYNEGYKYANLLIFNADGYTPWSIILKNGEDKGLIKAILNFIEKEKDPKIKNFYRFIQGRIIRINRTHKRNSMENTYENGMHNFDNFRDIANILLEEEVKASNLELLFEYLSAPDLMSSINLIDARHIFESISIYGTKELFKKLILAVYENSKLPKIENIKIPEGNLGFIYFYAFKSALYKKDIELLNMILNIRYLKNEVNDALCEIANEEILDLLIRHKEKFLKIQNEQKGNMQAIEEKCVNNLEQIFKLILEPSYLKDCINNAIKNSDDLQVLKKYNKAYLKYKNGIEKSKEGGNQNIWEAINCFAQAINLNEEFALAHYERGVLYYRKGMLDNAIEDFNIVIKLNNNNNTKNKSLVLSDEKLVEIIRLNLNISDVFNIRGCAYDKKRNLDEALKNYMETINLINITKELHDEYFKRCQKSLNKYNEYLELKKYIINCYVKTYKNMALVHIKMRIIDLAIKDCQMVASFDNANRRIFYNMGQECYNAEDMDDAVVFYSKAIEMEPDTDYLYSARCMAAFKKRDKSLAIEDFKKYVDLGPKKVDKLLKSIMTVIITELSKNMNEHNNQEELKKQESKEQLEIALSILELTDKKEISNKLKEIQKFLLIKGKSSENVIHINSRLKEIQSIFSIKCNLDTKKKEKLDNNEARVFMNDSPVLMPATAAPLSCSPSLATTLSCSPSLATTSSSVSPCPTLVSTPTLAATLAPTPTLTPVPIKSTPIMSPMSTPAPRSLSTQRPTPPCMLLPPRPVSPVKGERQLSIRSRNTAGIKK